MFKAAVQTFAVLSMAMSTVSGMAGTQQTASPSLAQNQAAAQVSMARIGNPLSYTMAKAHQVQNDFITSGMTGVYSDAFLNTMRHGQKRLYFAGDPQDAKQSLSEVVYFYCSLRNGVQFYESQDANGTFLEVTDACWDSLYNAIQNADQAWNGYKAYVAQACWSLQLDTSDTDLVNQINDFICDHYSYEVTNAGMPEFISSGVGQCWHYSKMFADMCNTVGIPASQIENSEHAWNQVTVDGVTYTFDVTYNDTSNSENAYSWMNPTGTARTSAGCWIQNEDGSWSYADASGALKKSSWVKSGSAWYYIDREGIMVTSAWVKTGGKWYYMKDSGKMATSQWVGHCWVNANGVWE